jgi:hypothetical protein
MNRLFAILLGFGASACKPAVDKKAEAVQEMERLETHRLKALEKATQGTIPKSKPSTFDPAVPVKPVPPEET